MQESAGIYSTNVNVNPNWRNIGLIQQNLSLS